LGYIAASLPRPDQQALQLLGRNGLIARKSYFGYENRGGLRTQVSYKQGRGQKTKSEQEMQKKSTM
jgi:hypothetical protein